MFSHASHSYSSNLHALQVVHGKPSSYKRPHGSTVPLESDHLAVKILEHVFHGSSCFDGQSKVGHGHWSLVWSGPVQVQSNQLPIDS